MKPGTFIVISHLGDEVNVRGPYASEARAIEGAKSVLNVDQRPGVEVAVARVLTVGKNEPVFDAPLLGDT